MVIVISNCWSIQMVAISVTVVITHRDFVCPLATLPIRLFHNRRNFSLGQLIGCDGLVSNPDEVTAHISHVFQRCFEESC